MLAACLDDPDKQVSLIEGRMRQLHSIYHESKSRLAELDRQERQHRKSLAARKGNKVYNSIFFKIFSANGSSTGKSNNNR